METVYRSMVLVPAEAAGTSADNYLCQKFHRNPNVRIFDQTDDICLALAQERCHALVAVFRWEWEPKLVSRLLRSIDTLGIDFTTPLKKHRSTPCPSLFLAALVGIKTPLLSAPRPKFPASCKVGTFTVIDYMKPDWAEKLHDSWREHTKKIGVQLGIGGIKTA